VNEIDLKKISIFSGLSADTLRILGTSLQHKTFGKGSVILWEKDVCRWVYFILDGEVEMFLLAPNGREQVLEHQGAGEGFNLVPAFKHTGNNHANVRAATDVELIRMNKDDFSELLERLPEFSRAVADYMAQRMARMVILIEELSLFSVQQRVASFLIKQADLREKRWTQDGMARRLGTVRDVIGRILRKFEDDGLIRFERQRILLLDREALRKFAVGEK
jgi:CRP/FNR family cyclic AMP-dependent transcriptional regulator